MKTIVEPERRTPVTRTVDVIVAGGGPAGIGAAAAAARGGAKTLLLEQYGILGGQATAGLVLHFQRWSIHGKRVAGGIPWEFARRITERNLRYNPPGPWNSGWEGIGIPPFDPEHLKYVADRILVESGVEILLHTFVCGVLQQDGKVNGLLVENKSGRQAFLAKIIIDATGDGDVAAFAGAPFEKGSPVDGTMQAMTMCFRVAGADYAGLSQHPMDASAQDATVRAAMLQAIERGELPALGGPWIVPSVRGEYRINAVRQWGDCTRAEDLSRAAVEGRRVVWVYFDWLKANFPEFHQAYVMDTGLQIGTRESRRILGDYVLTIEDVKSGRRPHDTIALGAHGVDIHSTHAADPGHHRMDWLSGAYGIPYRCLLPRGLENLLVSGRCISVTHEALASTRVMTQCMELGEAAGTAAAMSVKQGVTPRQLDPQLLCQTLEAQGVLLKDGVPI
jgi:hypothetical protein